MQISLTREEEIQQVELTIEEARKILAIGEAIERLENNEDFKKIIFEGYFVDQAARYTGLLAEPALQAADKQANIIHCLRGISELRQYLLTTKMAVAQCRHDLQGQLDLLEELRAEGPGTSDFGGEMVE